MANERAFRAPVFTMGTSGWSYKDWIGPFYPKNTKPNEFLKLYSKQFPAVEIDSTFYGIPRIKSVENWAGLVPESFRFSPKFPRIITHDKKLVDCDTELAAFLQNIDHLGAKLGPLVLQFDYTFRYSQMKYLSDFLKIIPSHYRIAVEIRHKSWLNDDFYELLTENRAALVLADLYYMPRMDILTTDFTYIRLLGNRKQVPDDFSHVRIDRKEDFHWWVDRVSSFLKKGVDVFLFVNNRYQGHAPASLKSFLEIMKTGERG